MTFKLLNNNDNKEKVKGFFQGKNWKKFLTFSFFLLMAFGFWVLQYLQQRFEIELSFPVKYENLPAKVALESGLPDELFLRVADKGVVLMNYMLRGTKDTIEIDLQKINPEKGSYLVPDNILEKEIAKRLLTTTTLISNTPNKITVKYTAQITKTIPVLINGNISLRNGYMFTDSIHVDPKEVTVYGNSTTLDTLRAIFTQSFNLKDLHNFFDQEVSLVFPDGIVSNSKTIKISGEVEGYTEKSFKLPVVCENVPDEYVVRLFPSSVDLICQVVLSKYTSLSETDFKLYVDYNTLNKDKGLFIPVEVSVKPLWLKSYRISPENIEFLIEKRSGL